MKRFYRDLERCPYVPGEVGYDEWMRKDDERLAQIDKNREILLNHAKLPHYRHNHDVNIRDMAAFVIEFLDENE